MMSQKYLHELLREDQEPFHLQKYISNRRCQLNRPRITLQVKKQKPIIESSTTKRSLCKQACFFSFHDSPDVIKSPIPDFLSPAKSPCKSPNTLLLHIPPTTADLLLEAAMRIQKKTSSKTKAQTKNVGLRLFGSMLKRLKDRNQTKKRQISDNGVNVSSTNESFRKSEKMKENIVGVDKKMAYEMSFSSSSNHSGISSVGWSESNEEKSLDLETSSSCRSEEIEFVTKGIVNGDSPCEKYFCPSPLRFSTQKVPSYRRTPDYLSPAPSPSHYNKEEKENNEADSLQKIQVENEEEKEQCSPVCVLDLFEDEGHEGRDEEDEECSYAIVQRAKQQLLQKLRRFEKLAELDIIELEKRMLDDEEECEEDESLSSYYYYYYREEGNNVHEFVRQVFTINHIKKIPKRLVLDLIAEEKREHNNNNGSEDCEVVAERVCKRLDSWKEVEFNTIDMMVELDFKGDEVGGGWKRFNEQVGEIAMEIELAIFGILIEEFSDELKWKYFCPI